MRSLIMVYVKIGFWQFRGSFLNTLYVRFLVFFSKHSLSHSFIVKIYSVQIKKCVHFQVPLPTNATHRTLWPSTQHKRQHGCHIAVVPCIQHVWWTRACNMWNTRCIRESRSIPAGWIDIRDFWFCVDCTCQYCGVSGDDENTRWTRLSEYAWCRGEGTGWENSRTCVSSSYKQRHGDCFLVRFYCIFVYNLWCIVGWILGLLKEKELWNMVN